MPHDHHPADAIAAEQDAAADKWAWLEDVHGARQLAWVKAQNALAFQTLRHDADYLGYYKQLLDAMNADDRIPYAALARDKAYNFWQDHNNPKGLWRVTEIADYMQAQPQWRVLLDIDALSAREGENWVFKGAERAPGEARALIKLSRGGGDAVVTREFDMRSLAFVDAGGFALAEAKSESCYLDDDHVLFGTDFGPGSQTRSGYPRIIKLWHRGRPVAEAPTVFEGAPSDVLVAPIAFHGPAGNVALVVRAVTFFSSEYYAVGPDGETRKLPLPLGAVATGYVHGHLLATLRDVWQHDGATLPQGALIAFPLDEFRRTGEAGKVAVLFAPGPRSSIGEVVTGRDAAYVEIYHNVAGTIHEFRLRGDAWTDTMLSLPGGGATHVMSANDWGPQVHVTCESYLQPTTLYSYDGEGEPRAIKSLPARFDSSGLVSEHHEAVSADGTRIPYFIMRPEGQVRPLPTILYGYGGFEVSLTPSYSAARMMWLTNGGAFVVANIRGGGEFGPAWHEAAMKEHRQRAFDDFTAVARDLQERGFTTPAQLAIMGGSNGGLLVSAAMVQHPELFGAVVCQVPLIDMLAYAHIGAGASWIDEYGDPADPRMRAAIAKYSPYQNVRRDRKYPPIFFVTATSDDRVTPVHARKMAARMEELGHDVLFYENTEGGHAAAADNRQAAEMWALSLIYLKRQLGLSARAPV